MIYNYTKCEAIIAKVMADTDSSDTKNRTTDIREWIFEAIDKIGAPMQYVQKEVTLPIQDHQVSIPEDLNSLDGTAYSVGDKGPWIPMLTKSAIFKNLKPAPGGNVGGIHNDHHCRVVLDKHFTSQSQLYTEKLSKYLTEKNVQEQPEYFIKPGWIVTNKHKGFVKIAYKAIAVDERGYPLVPDTTSYQEAIYWYIVMKLNFPKYMNSLATNKNVKMLQNIYFYMQQQWNFYRNQAYAEAMMPTADEMRNIKNEWNKLVPEFDADREFFRDINKEQTIYNDYYNGY